LPSKPKIENHTAAPRPSRQTFFLYVKNIDACQGSCVHRPAPGTLLEGLKHTRESAARVSKTRKAAQLSRKKEAMATETAAAPDFTQKHPLEHTWTLWFDNPHG
jgi:hypothetical protein